VVLRPIIRSAYSGIYSIYYLSHRYCYLPLSVGRGLSVLWVAYATHSTLKPVPTLPRKRQIAVTVWQIPDVVDAVLCAPNDGWKYHPKHVEQFPDINKLCGVASCWIYECTGILLGARPILHISRVKVKHYCQTHTCGPQVMNYTCNFESDLCEPRVVQVTDEPEFSVDLLLINALVVFLRRIRKYSGYTCPSFGMTDIFLFPPSPPFLPSLNIKYNLLKVRCKVTRKQKWGERIFSLSSEKGKWKRVGKRRDHL
jgi:hypothetical protein